MDVGSRPNAEPDGRTMRPAAGHGTMKTWASARMARRAPWQAAGRPISATMALPKCWQGFLILAVVLTENINRMLCMMAVSAIEQRVDLVIPAAPPASFTHPKLTLTTG